MVEQNLFRNWIELHCTPAFLQCLHPFRMAGHGEFTRWGKWQREPSTPDPQLRNKRHYGNDSVEVGWDHHFADSSMQGMTTTWFLPKGDIMSYLPWVDIVLNEVMPIPFPWFKLLQASCNQSPTSSQAAPYHELGWTQDVSPWTVWSMCL